MNEYQGKIKNQKKNHFRKINIKINQTKTVQKLTKKEWLNLLNYQLIIFIVFFRFIGRFTFIYFTPIPMVDAKMFAF